MRYRHSFWAVASLLATVVVLGCGKGGAGKSGSLGLNGVDSSGRCVPNTDQPFGPHAPLTAEQRQKTYQFLKDVWEVKRAEMYAEMVAYNADGDTTTPIYAQLSQATQAGQCSQQFGQAGDDVVANLEGGSCPLSYKATRYLPTKPSEDSVFMRSENSIRFNDLSLIGGPIRAKSLKQDHLMDIADIGLGTWTCAVTRGSIELVDGGKVETFGVLEGFSSSQTGTDLVRMETRMRRLLQFPDFMVELEEITQAETALEIDTDTINGEPMLTSELEAAGLDRRQLYEDQVGTNTF